MITLTSKLTLGPAENARPVITGVSAYVSLQSEDQSVLIRLPRFQHSKAMNGRQQPWARTHTASFMLRPQVQDQAAKGGKLFREKRSSDTALQAAVEPSLSPAEQWRLHHLNATAGERELTSAEKDEQQALIAAYNRSVLRRAKALAILAQRGHELSGILRVSNNDGE